MIFEASTTSTGAEGPEYFMLRLKVEKEFGYTHAVKIGDDLKISGTVSMDDNGTPQLPVIWNSK